MRTKPRKYQRQGVRMIRNFGGRALLADEMGLGKTFQALLYALKKPRARPVVVVCPAYLKYNWEREIATHVQMRAEILEGMKPAKHGMNFGQILIVNYDILGPWLKRIRKLKPQLVIIDECHYIKNRTARRTKNVRNLCKGIPHVIALSGTPLTNRPAELWPTLNILQPKIFSSFWSYAMEFCAPEMTRWGWKFTGATDLDRLHTLLEAVCMIRRLKKNVLKELPQKMRFVVPLEIKNRKEYDHALRDLIGWLRKTAPNKARKAAKAERVVRMGYLKRLVAKLKMDSVIQWIENWLEGNKGKLLVFTIHRSVIKALHEKFPNSVVVHGKIKGRKRQAAFDTFNEDKRCRLGIMNVQAGGVGWSAKGAATATVEIGWTPGEHSQAEDRIHGLNRGVKGQRSINYYLVARNTIEEMLCKIIQKKQEVLDATLDGKKGEASMDIFDQLTKQLVMGGMKTK